MLFFGSNAKITKIILNDLCYGKKMRFMLFAKRHCYKKAEKGIMA
jgi:hypothetical protein